MKPYGELPPKADIRSVGELIDYVSTLPEDFPYVEWVYRGQAQYVWDLAPRVFRTYDLGRSTDQAKALEIEQALFRRFKLRAWQFLDLSLCSDWDILALGQHHGLATRLLDWTRNPAIATYSAASTHSASDGALWSAVAVLGE